MKKLVSCLIVVILLVNSLLPVIVRAENLFNEEPNIATEDEKQEEKDVENNEKETEKKEENKIEEVEEKEENNEIENTEKNEETNTDIKDDNTVELEEEKKDEINSNEKEDNEEKDNSEENKLENTEEKEVNNTEKDTPKIEEKEDLSVKYRTHVQDIGWQDYVINGQEAGTTGRNLKVEAINIELVNNPSNINIKYTSYIQNHGWQNTVLNGEETGTTGKNLRMEAIKIWLENTSDYSVMYRTHVQDVGWQDWVYDGAIAGRLCDNLKIEAIEIKIVPKIQNTEMSVKYSSHVQDIGWQSEKQEYDISGTIGKNLKIEAMRINLKNAPEGISLKYRAYVENSGWQSWVSNGQEAGTTGKNKKMYGIRIMLEGTEEYSIQYRVHVQDLGWQPWVENGAIGGKISYNLKIEAIQIRIVKKEHKISKEMGLEYYTYLQGVSTNEDKIETAGEISGTTGQNRKVEGISIELINAPKGAHINYQAHVQDYGWMAWVKDGQVAGVLDRALKIEAIRIELEGLEGYTVEYRVHAENIGWTDWYIDGEAAGTTGRNLKIEAIQIRIVPEYKRYYKGIDVSYYQGEIDYDALVQSNQIDYMIPRIGWYSESRGRLMVDAQFERNYAQARARNIPIGAYLYSYATSIDEAKREAQAVVNYLENTNQKRYELPIFFDIEDNTQTNLGKENTSKIVMAFCEILKNAGYQVGVYSYEYFFATYMDLSMLPKDYSLWIANFGKNNMGDLPTDIYKYSDNYDIWQYTDVGTVKGINGYVDRSISYTKYF